MAGEDPLDAERVVREEVARVRVLAVTALRQSDREAVDGSAAVGVDQAADESFRMSRRELELPIGQLNRARVLASATVPGKRDQPQACACTERDRSGPLVRPNRHAWNDIVFLAAAMMSSYRSSKYRRSTAE